MRRIIRSFAAIALAMLSTRVLADDSQLARGEYLVRFGGCNDCHTPGYFLGKPDASRFLGGSDVGFDLPGLGTFVGPNLTPDREKGIGEWSRDEIIAALEVCVRPEVGILSAVM